MQYFEDIRIDTIMTLGPRALDLEDSQNFCRKFDNLPIHMDAKLAEQSIYGGLIASGLHTLSLSASIVVDGFLADTSMTGASCMSNVRWLKPVTLPNQLSVRFSAIKKTPPKAGRNFGTVLCLLETLDSDNDLVMTAEVNYLFHCRPTEKHIW